MKILYGVVGEGMGHATRSRVVVEHLLGRGHHVHVVASSRAAGYLRRTLVSRVAASSGRVTVSEIKGLSIHYEEGAMDRVATVTQNLLAVPSILAHNMTAFTDVLGSFQPEIVFSDFDSFAYLYARRARLPIVSIDNMQILARCKHPDWVKRGAKVDHQLAKTFAAAKLPRCDRYVITSFFRAMVRRKCAKDTILIPPILRREIIDAKRRATRSGPILVYQTSESSSALLLEALRRNRSHSFIIYGAIGDGVPDNCEVKRFDEVAFVTDLAQAAAVVQNGGFSLMSEAIHLGKPVFALPVRHQFEQELNARYLESLGLGVRARGYDELPRFLRTMGEFARRPPEIPGLLEEETPNGRLAHVLDDTISRILDKRIRAGRRMASSRARAVRVVGG